MPHMLKDALMDVLTPQERSELYSAFDMIGDIVIVKIPDSLTSKKELIANAILRKVKPAKSVFAQVSPVQGDFRIRDLEFLAGENRTLTEYREHGCRFKVDVAKTYFSPRLSTERLRIAKMVSEGEVVINMFGGVGTFSIVMAKIAPCSTGRPCKIYNIDSNSHAIDLCAENARINKVHDTVIPLYGDAAEAMVRLRGVADRVLMPLPEKASQFVDSAVSGLKCGKTGIVHYFAHIKANTKKAAQGRGAEDTDLAFKNYQHSIAATRVVREVGPRIYQIVSDVLVRA